MKTPAKPALKTGAKGGAPTPEGAKNVPGSEREAKLKGAPRPAPKIIGREFVSDHRGGAPLVIGKSHIQVKGDRGRLPR
jgi:hypothetical protein